MGKMMIIFVVAFISIDYLNSGVLGTIFYIWGLIEVYKVLIKPLIQVAKKPKNSDVDDYLYHWNKAQNDMEKEYGTIDWQDSHKK